MANPYYNGLLPLSGERPESELEAWHGQPRGRHDLQVAVVHSQLNLKALLTGCLGGKIPLGMGSSTANRGAITKRAGVKGNS